MGKLIGLAGSVGMLAFIVVLLLAFLRRIELLSAANVRRLKASCTIVFGAAAVYWFIACLMRGAVYGLSTVECTDISTIIPSDTLKKTLNGLAHPVFDGLFSGIYLFLGHLIGKILFEEYLLGGMALVWLLAIGGVFLLLYRGDQILGERKARETACLLFTLPGASFLLLPGGACLIFFLVALLLCILMRKVKPLSFSYSACSYTLLFVCSAVSSGALLFASVTGKLI